MSEKQSSKVTIAIPTLNRAAYLRLAVESALAQTYENFEVIVSDNASDDGTSEMLTLLSTDRRLRVLKQTVRLSMVENWNACIAASSGDYFLLLSDDDLLDSNALSEMVKSFEQGILPAQQVGVVYCRGRAIDEDGNVTCVGAASPQVEAATPMIIEFFNSRRSTWACTILFRKSDICEGYTENLPLAADAAQWMRAVARHGSAIFVDRILASYRVHRNISAMTPMLIWQKENLALAEYATATLKSAGRMEPGAKEEILEACRRLNVRLVPSLLNQRYARQRREALRAYGVHWRDFTSPYGVYWMFKGIVRLVLPGTWASLRRLRRDEVT
jgi:glycosyltransferase involved in cell wall biosynthesis